MSHGEGGKGLAVLGKSTGAAKTGCRLSKAVPLLGQHEEPLQQ